MGFGKFVSSSVLGISFVVVLGYVWGLFKEIDNPDLPVAQNVDLVKYQGVWFNIAELPFFWGQGCHCTQVYYEILPNGHVLVNNSCRYPNAESDVSAYVGEAWAYGNSTSKIRVKFFWPWAGYYWILEVADDYSWALVGHPTKRYMWIISRKPTLDKAIYDRLVNRLKELEFPVENIIKVDQSCGEKSNFPWIA